MSGNEAVAAVLAALDILGIPSIIVGSYSSNAYGIERSTRDADLVIQTERPFVAPLQLALGSSFHVDPQMSSEGVTATHRHIIGIVGSDFRVELFQLSDDEHD